ADRDQARGAARDRLTVLGAAVEGDVPLDERDPARGILPVVVRRLAGADVDERRFDATASRIGKRLVPHLPPQGAQHRTAEDEGGETERLLMRLFEARRAETLQDVGGAGGPAPTSGPLVTDGGQVFESAREAPLQRA